jgi:type I restriction enzyme M protein
VSEAGEGTIIRRIMQDVTITGWPRRKLAFKALVSDRCLFFITSMRMFLHDFSGVEVVHSNMAREACEVKKTKYVHSLRKHNHVLGSIPVEQQKRVESEQEFLEDTSESFAIALNKKSEFTHLTGMLQNLVPGGKLVVAVPPQVLYKQRSEGQFRKKLIEEDMVEAVIQLPSKLYQNTPAAYSILVIRKFKSAERRRNILFIDAGKEFIEGRKQNILPDESIKDIITIYRDFRTFQGKSRLVPLKEVMDCDFSLEVNRYINPFVPSRVNVDFTAKLIQIKSSSSEKNSLIDLMIDSIRKLEKLADPEQNG